MIKWLFAVERPNDLLITVNKGETVHILNCDTKETLCGLKRKGQLPPKHFKLKRKIVDSWKSSTTQICPQCQAKAEELAE